MEKIKRSRVSDAEPHRRLLGAPGLLAFLAILALSALAQQSTNSVVKVVSSLPVVVQGHGATITAGVDWTASAAPSGAITITDTVTCPGGSAATTVALGTITLGVANSATPGAGTLVVPAFPCAGANSLSAAYAGDGRYSQSVSQPLVEMVLAQFSATTTTLTSTTSASGSPQSTTYTARLGFTVTNKTYPTGAVVFTDTNTGSVLGTVNVQTTGAAVELMTLASLAIAPGPYAVQAAYSGDNIYAPSASQILGQSIPAATPAILAFGNAASYASGAVSPGEIVSLFAPSDGLHPIGPARGRANHAGQQWESRDNAGRGPGAVRRLSARRSLTSARRRSMPWFRTS